MASSAQSMVNTKTKIKPVWQVFTEKVPDIINWRSFTLSLYALVEFVACHVV